MKTVVINFMEYDELCANKKTKYEYVLFSNYIISVMNKRLS